MGAMRVIVFGATGMVGLGALREALADPDVEAVLSISRQSCGVTHPKLRERLLPDLFDLSGLDAELTGWDAAVWALGISSVGVDEAAYARVTEELTLIWARELLRQNPTMSFCYCSAAGAGGRSMWARVRQRLEGTLQSMPFRNAGAVRPAVIRPGPGIGSRTPGYQLGLVLMKPFFWFTPLWLRSIPFIYTTSENLGRAMIRVTQGKNDTFILESADINRLGR